MSSVGLALSGAAGIGEEFAQEQPSNAASAYAPADPVVPAPVQNPLSSGAPQDTVTLSHGRLPSSTPQNQSTTGLTQGAPSAAFETSSAAAGRYDRLNAKSNSNPSAVTSAQIKADGNPTTASHANAVQASSVTAQEQLTQLDRTLQQLGINPDSVSLIRRVELLRLANDPAALEQSFQSSASPAGPAASVPSTAVASSTQPQVAGSASNGSTGAPAASQSTKPIVTGTHLNVSA